jgi:hypothetical protein
MENRRTERVAELRNLLRVSPGDVLARCDLAAMLEELDLCDEALCNWKAVLNFDPNNLKAREGVNRCRIRTGPPPQSER